MRVALISKPWKGGLADYVAQALIARLGREHVTTISTRPTTRADAIARKRDKAAWEQQLVERIENTLYDAAIFIHPLPAFAALSRPQKNIVWLVDDAKISDGLLNSMGHLFLSDPGYEADAKALIPPQQFAGVLPFALLPEVHRPATTPAANPAPMCFVANRDAKRTAWLKQIFAAGMSCHVYGNYFFNDPLFFAHPLSMRRPVAIGQMQQIYARHQISLNIHAQIVAGGTNMRTYEAAGYGIAQLVEHRPGLEQLFEIGQEILCFKTIEGLKEGYSRLLREPDVARTMAQKARARVLAEHTYQHRIEAMLTRL